MKAEGLLSALLARGVRLIPDGDGLIVEPASGLTDADRHAIRARKPQLLALLRSGPSEDRAARTRSVRPDSHHPPFPPEVRAKIEAIEADARAKGWPAELFWNNGYGDCPRGHAAILDPDDEIAEVTPDHISILKTRRDLLASGAMLREPR